MLTPSNCSPHSLLVRRMALHPAPKAASLRAQHSSQDQVHHREGRSSSMLVRRCACPAWTGRPHESSALLRSAPLQFGGLGIKGPPETAPNMDEVLNEDVVTGTGFAWAGFYQYLSTDAWTPPRHEEEELALMVCRIEQLYKADRRSQRLLFGIRRQDALSGSAIVTVFRKKYPKGNQWVPETGALAHACQASMRMVV